jgi:preprotein translocase subunit YajC
MLNYILLLAPAATEGAAEGAAQQGSGWSFWIMMLLIFVAMYFFMIRPQQKKQKELQQQRESLKKGDKVVTAGGIYGQVKEVQETTFLIEVSKDVTLKVDKGSVYVAAEDAQQAPKA